MEAVEVWLKKQSIQDVDEKRSAAQKKVKFMVAANRGAEGTEADEMANIPKTLETLLHKRVHDMESMDPADRDMAELAEKLVQVKQETEQIKVTLHKTEARVDTLQSQMYRLEPKLMRTKRPQAASAGT